MAVKVAYCQTVIPLYPGRIPGSKQGGQQEGSKDIGGGNKFIYNTSLPTITSYLPAGIPTPAPAVIIFPGGGYAGVSVTAEGEKVAQAFNKIGVAAFVVKYRMPSNATMADKKKGPLQDAEQAIFIVRKNASKWKIDPQRTGVLGFSAGGHLAACLSTKYREKHIAFPEENSILRPSFCILVYPVISMTDSLTHEGSRTNLLGLSPTPIDVSSYSAEMQVDEHSPVSLLIHCGDDKAVKVENSIAYYMALRKHQVEAELIIYPKGGHGFGLENSTTTDRWFERCREWMLANHWL